ncbi:DNA-directed DNA polymerase II small subunit [Methanothermococcus sp.]|uniref:DNA-directed DNA polymerase II small subunit n=1 Tax=Methanothermococcus sp. TaxID=2614238 RepID=UPI0025CE3083|nr:DNA-directed DNA polymerase II small subunit [Methanothermococcus sp.]
MINDFLNIEVLISPSSYDRIKKLSENERDNLINKIKKFKDINDKFILLDAHFLDVFLNYSLNEIKKNYGNFDFLAYYTSDVNLEINNPKIENIDKKNKELKSAPLQKEKLKIEHETESKPEPKKETVKPPTSANIDENKIEEILKSQSEELKRLNILEKEREKRLAKIKSIRNSINKRINYISKDIEAKIKVYDEWDISGKSTCEGTIDDFVKYFRDRYAKIKAMIERKVQRKAYPLNKVYKLKKESDVFVVGIVSDVSSTKKGHKRVEIEDENTSFTVIMMKDKIASGDLPDDILLDEVIGFSGYIPDSGNVMFANKYIRPDITPKKPKNIDEKIYTAFLSDIHVGSYEFLEKSFRKFVEFLNGNVNNGLEEKIISRLKYISIAGDLVDGVGIYPGQEYDLYDVDIISQYKEIAAYLEEVPEHIHIIIAPGNHDATRPAEPQPIFPERILKLFDGLDNITFLSNPGFANIHGLDFLLYHGRSFDDIISQISSAKYNNPTSIMRELLIRRHLCPTYGGRCPIAPEHEDYLVIHNEPDIFHTGHIHINGYGLYKGTVMINSGTFQEQTNFQKKMGINPTPARVPILDLSKTGSQYIEWNNGKIEVK